MPTRAYRPVFAIKVAILGGKRIVKGTDLLFYVVGRVLLAEKKGLLVGLR